MLIDIDKKGDRTFMSKGTVDLPNRLEFKLMVAADRENQAKRDAWVAKRLGELIAEGRADELEEGQVYDPPYRGQREHSEHKREPLRLDIPW